jgi:hypothetical protein
MTDNIVQLHTNDRKTDFQKNSLSRSSLVFRLSRRNRAIVLLYSGLQTVAALTIFCRSVCFKYRDKDNVMTFSVTVGSIFLHFGGSIRNIHPKENSILDHINSVEILQHKAMEKTTVYLSHT